MPLTDTAIRNAEPGEKPVKLFDERGLYLEISPIGGKWWRLKYHFDGKEKRLSLGVYPDVGLKDARDRYLFSRGNGGNPSSFRNPLCFLVFSTMLFSRSTKLVFTACKLTSSSVLAVLT